MVSTITVLPRGWRWWCSITGEVRLHCSSAAKARTVSREGKDWKPNSEQKRGVTSW